MTMPRSAPRVSSLLKGRIHLRSHAESPLEVAIAWDYPGVEQLPYGTPERSCPAQPTCVYSMSKGKIHLHIRE